jgi:hypothetical protein
MGDILPPGAIPTTILHHLSDGSCQTIDAIEAALGLTRRQISDGAAKLILRGYVERTEVGCYQLTSAGAEAQRNGVVITSGPWRPDTVKVRKPVRDTFRQRVWNAMRMSGTFTVGDLVVAAARDELDAENNTSWYLRRLAAAGYVIELPIRQKGTRLTSSGFKRWRLIHDTGPIAPAYRRKLDAVHDYNTGKDVGCARTA